MLGRRGNIREHAGSVWERRATGWNGVGTEGNRCNGVATEGNRLERCGDGGQQAGTMWGRRATGRNGVGMVWSGGEKGGNGMKTEGNWQ